MSLKRIAMVLAELAALAGAGWAQERVSWSEFTARITPRHTLRVALPDGTVVECRPVEMRSDEIFVRIVKTSNRKTHPKGQAVIPRTAISVVDVRSPRSLGKVVGTLAPIGVGAALSASAYGKGDDMYVQLVAGGLTMAGGGVGGFFIGRAIDRRFEQFVVEK